MKILLIDNSFEVTLREFLHTNTSIPDVDHISDDDVKKLEALQLGESLCIGLCNVKFSKLQYKGYTIQEDHDRIPYNKDPQYMFYPTAQGIQHDADGDSEGYHYCGNCKWADSVEDAKDSITEILLSKLPDWKVQSKSGIVETITWLSDAVKTAVACNGILVTPFHSI